MIFDVLLYDILVWYWSDLEWIGSVILLIHHSYHPSQHLAQTDEQTVGGASPRSCATTGGGTGTTDLLEYLLGVSVENMVGAISDAWF